MDNNKEIASEMHRWGRMTGVFALIGLMTWLLLDTIPSAPTAMVAVKDSFLWPGIALAILATVGMFGGFSLEYLAGHKR